MKIGVITPVYNDPHLMDAIKCVQNQILPKECIIHYIFNDGGSNHVPFVEEPDLTNIRLYGSPSNQGISFARNNLIDRAKADGCTHLAFLDSDDVWYENHLEGSLMDMELQKCDVVYSPPKHIFVETGEQAWPAGIPLSSVFIGKQFMYGNFIHTSTLIAKIECFDKIKFDTQLDGLEDWDVWYSLWEAGFKFYKRTSISSIHRLKRIGANSLGILKRDIFNLKHKTLPSLKLNLACGPDYMEDYINVDNYGEYKVDAKFDVSSLPFDDNTIDEIKAFHIIEHFDFFEGQKVLSEWYRVLKPGGRIWIETPDFLESCREFVNETDESKRVFLYGHFFSDPWIPGQAHKFLFTENQLTAQLGWCGFKNVKRLPPSSRYIQWLPKHIFLNVEAIK
jgi:glycosyltransferase involved in cell wall biosynthesis